MKLPQDDVALFYDIFFKLIDYTNDRYQVVPGLEKASGAEDVNPVAIMPVRDKLWENDDVINCIVSDNPFCFAERELSLVASWKRRVTGNFLIYKHLKKYTVFMGNGALYGVVGLASPIEDIFPSFDLPRYLRVTLLPFEGKIIYDSLLYTYNVTFGSGSRRGFNEEYRELKNMVGIITKLQQAGLVNTYFEEILGENELGIASLSINTIVMDTLLEVNGGEKTARALFTLLKKMMDKPPIKGTETYL